jgi:TonB family protein
MSMRWASLPQAVIVSCLVHGMCAGLLVVRWEGPSRRHGPSVSAFLGSVLGEDDVRQRVLGERRPLGAAGRGRLFPAVPSRSEQRDDRVASVVADKPARARAQPAVPPMAVTAATWPLPQQGVVLTVGAPQIEGRLRARPLVYLPPVPRAPAWMQPLAVETVVAVRIWVAPSGQIRRVEPLVSSGDPSLDRLVLRYLRGWIFVPLAVESASEVEMGIVRLSLHSAAHGDEAP